jgi:hypothetical protein
MSNSIRRSVILTVNGIPQNNGFASTTNRTNDNPAQDVTAPSQAPFNVVHYSRDYQFTRYGQISPTSTDQQDFDGEMAPEDDEAVSKAIYGALLDR